MFRVFMRALFFGIFSFFLFLIVLLSDQSWCASASAEDSTESLRSLPYIQYVETEKAPNKVGTTIYKKDKAFSGYNIYTSDNSDDVFVRLIDMDGVLVHKWAIKKQNGLLRWKQVTPFPDGSIFLTSEMTTPDWQWVDANSHSFHIYDMPGYEAHHAAYCLKDGGFIGLVRNMIRIPFKDKLLQAWDNSLVRIAPEGRVLMTISLNKLLETDPGYQKKLQEAYDNLKDYGENASKEESEDPIFDLFHANNVANLEWDIRGIAKKGDWLVTVLQLDRIFIVDPEKEKVVWQWGENIISGPHHATFLSGDRVLLFDNGFSKKSSRVIIVDIKSKKIIWQYGQSPGQEFFTPARGSAQRFPNGNTLIADSENGRVFEVTSVGEIVWEWYADFYTKGQDQWRRRVIYRMERIPYDFFKDVKFNYGKILLESRN